MVRGPPRGLGPWQIAWLLAVALAFLRLPALPPVALLWTATVLGLVLLPWRSLLLRGVALALLGIGWTGVLASLALDDRWEADARSDPLTLSVRVEGLPDSDAISTRFRARVLEAPAGSAELAGRQLQVSWFAEPPPVLQPGEVWRLPVRLRPPRGLRNPGGFDFERHALVQGIDALGTVSGQGMRLAEAQGIDLLRSGIATRIADSEAPASALLRGLAVGDTRALENPDWDRLRLTGLSHLLAISGLHIGMVAGFAALLLRALYWAFPRCGLRMPLPQAAALAALLAATGYAVLAGLSLPTLRSVLMLAVALAAVLWRREGGLAQPLALSAAALWLLDPLSLLSPGFWLSLGGVFWLLACVPRSAGWRAAGAGLLRAQLVLGLALLPLSVAFFGGSSLIGLALNLLAVPWVTLCVVPVLLLGVLLMPWVEGSALLLQGAGAAMQALWDLAGLAAEWQWAYLYFADPGAWGVLLALLGLLGLLAPRGVPARALCALLLAPLLWPSQARLNEGEYQVDVLDVGQGLAVLVRTATHSLLYDAGARSRSGFDMGDAVVVPALRALGVHRLDRVLVSHGDNDHAGGLSAVRAAFPQAEVWAGEPARSAAEPCLGGTEWHWDGVHFSLLHPPAHFPELGNESSCVLRVAGPAGISLLPGDIGEVVEQRLLRERAAALAAQLLVVPHHGSRSSSSADFVAAVAPRWAVISAAAGNRFGHPHAEVVERYRLAGAALMGTASLGRIGWRFDGEGARVAVVERHAQRRFWQIAAD